MVTIRRWYIFLVAAVSLNVVAWALIALAQDLATGQGSVFSLPLQIAIALVGLPVFLVHWLWAQRLARTDPAERRATLRAVYLYGMQAGFLGPLLASIYQLVLNLFSTTGNTNVLALTPGQSILRELVAMAALALLWFYHHRVAAADETALGAELDRTVRRLYTLGFSMAGYAIVALASIHLLRWLLYQINAPVTIGGGRLDAALRPVASIIVGLPVWLVFWSAAQRAFNRNSEEARSALRKFYLYAIIFNAVLAVVTNLAFILAGLIRRVLDLPSMGDIRQPLPIIVILAVAWAYHAGVLRADAAAATGEAPRALSVGRLYQYLVAAVGLAAGLVGLGGLIGVLITAMFARSLGPVLAEQFAWYTASLIAGFAVWVLPWRQAQTHAVAEGPAGREERQSAVRKLYLYFFLFAATMTFLTSAVYILYTLLNTVLGANRDDPLTALTSSVAYCLIAVAVWVYHGSALRADGRRGQQEHAARLAGMKVAVADTGDGDFGRRLAAALKRELPALPVEVFGLTPAAALALAPAEGTARRFELAEADVIAGPWTMAAPALAGVPDEMARVVAASPARKLLAPVRLDGWQWAGGDAAEPEAQALLAARSVRQIVQGEEVRGPRPLSAGAIFAIAIGAIMVLFVVVPLIFWLAYSAFRF